MRLCTHCGKPVNSDSAQFCENCGQNLTTPDAPLPDLTAVSEDTPGSKASSAVPKKTWFLKKRGPKNPKAPVRFSFRRLFRKAVSMIIILGVLYGGALFLLSLEHKLGLWEKFTFQRTLDGWKKDKRAMAQEKPLLAAINGLADALDSGDLDKAMDYVHPGRQEMIRKELEALGQDPAALPALTSALRKPTVTFIGTADDNPEEAPFRAQVSIPAEDLTLTLTWIMINEKWVVTRI